ncbi:MAG: outer membrane beta-barrel protein [Nitrospirae bacterium]|nr:outer membrane beta-barrel protein [Nitrospirota bacterium]
MSSALVPSSALVSDRPVSGTPVPEAPPVGSPRVTGLVPSAEQASDRPVSGTPVPEAPPVGSPRVTGEIFERKSRLWHPFAAVEIYHTDNVFNSPKDKKGDFALVLTAGINLFAGFSKEGLPKIETASITPGGATSTRLIPFFPGRVKTYLGYKADIERYLRYSSENTTSHAAEGVLQYNIGRGLLLDISDQYLKTHTLRGSGLSGALDKYYTNHFHPSLSYEIGDKTLLRFDYTHFLVRYTEAGDDFRNRSDNSLSGYAFYKVRPKTSVFAQYEFVDIEYDRSVLSSSSEQHIFGGLRWEVTAKSKGLVKAGYGLKKFDNPALGDSRDLIYEAEVDHHFTPKTSLTLNLSRRTNETDISTTNFMTTNSITALYSQKFTAKITGTVKLSYANDAYDGLLTFDNETKKREDNLFNTDVALRYEPKEWLKLDAGYSYTRRDSNFAAFDYTNNKMFIRVIGSP